MTAKSGVPVPTLSVVIPVLDAAKDLPGCLASIAKQTDPGGGFEVVIADGGSRDTTREIAARHGARVIDNPHARAEPGVAVGIQASRGRFITVMAADNRMRGVDFMVRMVEPFSDPRVVAAFPRVVSTVDDRLVNRYFNRYSDPFNHFIYGSMNTSIDLKLRRGERIISPSATDHPLLAVAQGCTVRADLVYKGAPEYADDVVAIIQLLELGGKLALVGEAELEHHHVGGLLSVYRKYWRRTREALNGRQGYLRRESGMSRRRRLRRWLWIPYSASLAAPTLHGVALALRHRDPLLLYHPVVNTVVFAAVLRGAAAKALRRPI